MDALLTQSFLASLLTGAVISAVPLILAGLGEQFSERAGVLNIGLEGMMLTGACAAFAADLAGGGLWGGLAAALLAGSAVGALVAFLCVRLGLNQIIVGIAVTLGASGLTALIHNTFFAKTYPRLDPAPKLALPVLSEIPVLGQALFTHNPATWIALGLPAVFALLYRHSYLGLNLAAAGEKPEALDAAGISVTATRVLAALVAGGMAGLGGGYMATIGSGIFVPHMTAGAGYIAIVLAMLARARPLWVMAGSLIFGACLAATTALQVGGIDLPTDIIQMLPFVMVMLVLVLFGRSASLPAALGQAYHRGRR